mmetsp:Transcript_14571/g.40047  ORF Transcript_14571/g.40047 Transcript_14571/m.40047 type:complete len:86 (+) Transcript_14571:199-456(+)
MRPHCIAHAAACSHSSSLLTPHKLWVVSDEKSMSGTSASSAPNLFGRPGFFMAMAFGGRVWPMKDNVFDAETRATRSVSCSDQDS